MLEIKVISIKETKDKKALFLSDGEARDILFMCPHCGVITKTVWLCPDVPMPIFGLRCCGNSGIILPIEEE